MHNDSAHCWSPFKEAEELAANEVVEGDEEVGEVVEEIEERSWPQSFWCGKRLGSQHNEAASWGFAVLHAAILKLRALNCKSYEFDGDRGKGKEQVKYPVEVEGKVSTDCQLRLHLNAVEVTLIHK